MTRYFDDLEGWKIIDPDHAISPLGCCEGPCVHEGQQDPDPNDPEVQAWLLAELLAHWAGKCEQFCSHCFEEHEVRRLPLGIEDVNLYEDSQR